MEYKYEIFLSYARGDMEALWVKERFMPKLKGYLRAEVGRVEISVDYEIQPGINWDINLKRRIATSRIMLPLLSADYFHSEWCRKEMALMLEREQSIGLNGRDQEYGLLIPIRLGDGLTFPDIISHIQYIDFAKYFDPDLPDCTMRASSFNIEVQKLAQVIARVLPRVPTNCSEAWNDFTGEDFMRHLCAKPLFPPPSRLLV
jgi:hypothetical protein